MRAFVDRLLRNVLIALMGAMVLNVLWQVFSRFILKDPSSYTDELARYMLMWIGLLGAGYVTGQKLHLAIDILPRALEGRRKRLLEYVIDLGVGAFALLAMVVGGSRLVFVTLTLEQTSAALQIPLGWVYSVIPASGVLILFYCACSIFEKLTDRSGEKVA